MNLAEKQRKKRNKQVPLVDEQFFTFIRANPPQKVLFISLKNFKFIKAVKRMSPKLP